MYPDFYILLDCEHSLFFFKDSRARDARGWRARQASRLSYEGQAREEENYIVSAT